MPHELTWGRDVQSALRAGHSNVAADWPGDRARQADLEHELAAAYLIGTLAYLEGRDGTAAWRGSGVRWEWWVDRSAGVKVILDESDFEVLKCIRDAVVHNERDVALNHDGSCHALDQYTGIDGVAMDGSVVSLDLRVTERIRQLFIRLSRHHGVQVGRPRSSESSSTET